MFNISFLFTLSCRRLNNGVRQLGLFFIALLVACVSSLFLSLGSNFFFYLCKSLLVCLVPSVLAMLRNSLLLFLFPRLLLSSSCRTCCSTFTIASIYARGRPPSLFPLCLVILLRILLRILLLRILRSTFFLFTIFSSGSFTQKATLLFWPSHFIVPKSLLNFVIFCG